MRTLLITTASIAVMAFAPAVLAQTAAPSQWSQNYTSSRDVVCNGQPVPYGTQAQGSDCTVWPTSTSKTGISATGSSGSRGQPSVSAE